MPLAKGRAVLWRLGCEHAAGDAVGSSSRRTTVAREQEGDMVVNETLDPAIGYADYSAKYWHEKMPAMPRLFLRPSRRAH